MFSSQYSNKGHFRVMEWEMEEWFPFVQSTNYPFPTLANHMTSKSNAMMYTVIQ